METSHRLGLCGQRFQADAQVLKIAVPVGHEGREGEAAVDGIRIGAVPFYDAGLGGRMGTQGAGDRGGQGGFQSSERLQLALQIGRLAQARATPDEGLNAGSDRCVHSQLQASRERLGRPSTSATLRVEPLPGGGQGAPVALSH